MSEDYRVKVGMRVCHIKDPEATGTVISVDDNLEDVTTCVVLWDDGPSHDVQWTNKLVAID